MLDKLTYGFFGWLSGFPWWMSLLILIVIIAVALFVLYLLYIFIADKMTEAKKALERAEYERELERRNKKSMKRYYKKANSLKKRYLHSGLTDAILAKIKEESSKREISSIYIDRHAISIWGVAHDNSDKFVKCNYSEFGYDILSLDQKDFYFYNPHHYALAMAINEKSGNAYVLDIENNEDKPKSDRSVILFNKKNYKKPESKPEPKLKSPI